ncbi:MAG: nicotinate-nucleotide--dimethylbenzimidazole phosphoribosyltransferase [Clostridia bacterium]|jgi:nicotinate-nucleotide--dimethylbenzimidazole phosphoribosyltransferase|nr:nicotinate-nucleotide--dimethylbenzimidazole phosphoribosyltransferase [Clostridia bacterium]MDH7573590.1 nicotinate-nucleotide--dimethylbenzimidazole phosphoribosyltransferase [Clostridia bacterium]
MLELPAIPKLDEKARLAAQARLDELTKPPGSLGRLEDLAAHLAAITGSPLPDVPGKAAILMAADHGVAEEGVSAFPQEVTAQMVANFARGGAAMSVLSRHVGAELVVVDVGVARDLPPIPGVLSRKVAYGTRNFTRGPAMTREEAERAVAVGLEVVKEVVGRGARLIALGEMGIANTTASTAIAAVYGRRPVAELAGRGTGVDDGRLKQKIACLERALEVNRPDPADAWDVLCKVGGLEIAGLAGAAIGAAASRCAVLLDGLISTAAALIAVGLAPGARDYLIASHLSAEPGHAVMLGLLGLKPVLFMDMRLGEGTGAALVMPVVEAAVKILREMATFGEAGVSNREE